MSQYLTGGFFNPLNIDVITPIIISFVFSDLPHALICKYSFLIPFISTNHGVILLNTTNGHVAGCGATLGKILDQTYHDNVSLFFNSL